ncbi:CLUMA_CG016792, isoform A [Clunio marinus]|uniref:CLUMA_CG016792, isoform A n=1 Tax=Clunio marinus TaxID=568069 RepID=A0A1J1IU44_9DIPT|nr:CLUMA_CG016792, isoform A [Clunio marinus]
MDDDICYLLDIVPAEVKQIIFQYLGVEDLLSLCCTCKSLNEFIGSSHDCMKKIWIKFYTFKLKDLDSLKSSVRIYEKLKVNRVKLNEHFIYLADLHQSWRKILIYNCELKRMELLLNFIKTFSETVEELEISDIEVLNNEIDIKTIKFPNLKRLMFRNVPSTIIEAFLDVNKKLENVSFDIVLAIEGKMSLEELTDTLLHRCQHLNHLQLGPHYIKCLFDQENCNVNYHFKLSKLLLKFPLIRDPSPNISMNVKMFLKDQPNIEWILFLELDDDDILNPAWNEIPSLNHLTFYGLEELFKSMELQMQPNNEILQIDLLSRKILISQLRKVFVAAPNLRVLHVHTLTKYIIEFTVKNHQMIREICYENIEEEAEQFYESLKSSFDEIKNTKVCYRKSAPTINIVQKPDI